MPDRGHWMATGSDELRFKPFWYLLGAVARFWYRLTHWDWTWPQPLGSDLSLSDIVAQFNGPVYGFLDTHRELRQGGHCYGSHAEREDANGIIDQVEFEYFSGRVNEPTLGVSVETRRHSHDPEITDEVRALMRTVALRIGAQGAAFEFGTPEFRESQMGTSSAGSLGLASGI